MAANRETIKTLEHGIDPLSDPDEARILHAALDSFRYDHEVHHRD
jgi:hypothetical protein